MEKRSNLPETFAIPNPEITKKIQICKPPVTEKGYKPEPTVDQSLYTDILQVIHDVGEQFERLPSTYAGKKEENPRDHFLLFFAPHFVGTATARDFQQTWKDRHS